MSILIPSRGRPRDLRESIESCLALASETFEVEAIARLDEDDEATLASKPPARCLVGPRRDGYADMASYWNELAEAAQGDWLFIMNDDARLVKSAGWDLHLDSLDLDLIYPRDNSETSARWKPGHGFPILRRSVYERLGHLTLYAGVDSWLWRLRDSLNWAHTERLVIDHKRIDDATLREGRVWLNAHSREFQADPSGRWDALLAEDRGKLV